MEHFRVGGEYLSSSNRGGYASTMLKDSGAYTGTCMIELTSKSGKARHGPLLRSRPHPSRSC